MIRRPGHLANRDVPASGAPEQVPGVDLALAAHNVRAAGGDAGRFGASLAAAQRLDAAPEHAVSLAGIAAWRAGALALRDDALARLDVLRADAAGRRAVAAALFLAEDAVDEFAERQASDRFWWPGRAEARGYVCAVGGFRGLGGAWTAPPDAGRSLGDDGVFAIRSGADWWRLDADVFGSRLVRLDEQPRAAASDSRTSIVCLEDSYLAWVHVKDAA
ncbi:potassium transporter Kef [Microbacterium sp. NEAU-LLC]|uniref:Potassium transporter Kef n=1 Tax=Microbacterium helvum TaxID=2773713 RepID=A0ABR8NHV4_9MICO|nr:potassium transporter Kef [Microbacterium helvum]MBD3940264.1 potassium transporter Kef [Microbacterium helvum]